MAAAWMRRRGALSRAVFHDKERWDRIGLAMVYGVVQRHGVDVEIEMRAAKGRCLLALPVPVTPSPRPPDGDAV